MNNNVDLNCKERLASGIKLVYDAVKSTFGPNGYPAFLRDTDGTLNITKDGITVANYVSSEDSIEAIGIELVRQASKEANEISGDGSTTTTILTAAMLIEGVYTDSKYFFQRECRQVVIPYLRSLAIDINKRPNIIRSVAKLTSNGDEEIANMLFHIFHKLGSNVDIKIEQSNGESKAVINDYFLIEDVYYNSPYFINKSGIDTNIEGEFNIILLENDPKSINDIIDRRKEDSINTSYLILTPKLSTQLRELLEINIKSGKLDNIVILEYQKIRRYSRDIIEDFKTLNLENPVKVKYDYINSRLEVKAASTRSTSNRVRVLKNSLKSLDYYTYEYRNIKFRIANLLRKRATIYLGTSNELEYTERRDRLEDAINATRNALDNKVVLGAGLALLDASYTLYKQNKISKLLANALKYPHKLLIESGVYMTEIEAIKHNIYDPLETLVVALEKASSLADLVKNSKVAIIR